MPNPIRVMIAAEVRAALARAGRTHRELAEVLEIDQPSASRRLSGERPFRGEELVVIAGWLELPIGELMDRPARAAA